MLTRMALLLTRMARMAPLLTHMARMARLLTDMARMLTRMTRWLAYYTHSGPRTIGTGHCPLLLYRLLIAGNALYQEFENIFALSF